MIVSAIVKCKWCGTETIIPEKQTTRSFMIAFNKLRRLHDWDCKAKESVRLDREKANKATDNAIKKMMAGDL